MIDKESSGKPKSMAEMDFIILCDMFGKQSAIEIMKLINALHEESAIRIGRKKVIES